MNNNTTKSVVLSLLGSGSRLGSGYHAKNFSKFSIGIGIGSTSKLSRFRRQSGIESIDPFVFDSDSERTLRSGSGLISGYTSGLSIRTFVASLASQRSFVGSEGNYSCSRRSFVSVCSNKDMSDKERQEEEVSTLAAIFDADFKQLGDDIYQLVFKVNAPEQSDDFEVQEAVTLEFAYPATYPSKEPPVVLSLRAQWLNTTATTKLVEELHKQVPLNEDVVVYRWIEWLKENTISFLKLEHIMKPKLDASQESVQDELQSSNETIEEEEKEKEVPFDIFTGEAVTDRKSKFVGHVAAVFSESDVDRLVNQLKNSNKKIATATHNIVAYRFIDQSGKLVEGRDDDGESGAGDKMLFMLQQKNALNVCVIVTRWYGGINLGNDRFKHITNIAKETLEASGLLSQSTTTASNNNTQKNAKSKNKKK